jgi:hypothetical protein
MRVLAWIIPAIAALSTATPAPAQTYDPNYPVCMQVYSPRGGGYNDCSFTSLPQCSASASGRAAHCIVNPFYAYARNQPSGRAYRRRERVY